jgi:ACS family glucarate transporter-like MFS transporter
MKYQHRVLGMLSLLAVITYLDRVCIAVAGPRMQDALHISPEAWGWVTSVFFLSYSAFEIPTGALGDRIGPRRVLTRVVAWWSAFTSLTGIVSNYYPLSTWTKIPKPASARLGSRVAGNLLRIADYTLNKLVPGPNNPA